MIQCYFNLPQDFCVAKSRPCDACVIAVDETPKAHEIRVSSSCSSTDCVGLHAERAGALISLSSQTVAR